MAVQRPEITLMTQAPGWPPPQSGSGQSFELTHARGPTWKTYVLRWLGTRPNLDVLISRLGRQRIRGRRILLVGVGEAQEVGFWAPYRPALIVSVDMFAVAGVEHYVVGDASRLPFEHASFDVVASINAFEHFVDPAAVLREMVRVLRPGATLLASFGPLWHSIGGDHFSIQRGGLEHGFAHLELDDDAYARFVDHMTIEGEDVVEGRAVGARGFLADGLFSRWTAAQYRDLFAAYLEVEHLAERGIPLTAEFRAAFPDRWAALERRYGAGTLETSVLHVIGRVRHPGAGPARRRAR